jgi:hypothetical protein
MQDYWAVHRHVGDGDESNVIKARRGEVPFSSDIGALDTSIRPMPAGDPVSLRRQLDRSG